MSSVGRPRILDDKKRQQIVTLIGVGLGLQDAVRYAGCSVSTARREMLRDPEFCNDCRAAEVRSQLEALRAMRDAASTHWRAAAWMLERTNPRRFARPSSRSFKVDELRAVFDDVVQAAVEEIDDPVVRARVTRRLVIAGSFAARHLESEPTHRLDPRAVVPSRQTAEDRAVEKFLQELEDERQETLRNLRRGNEPAGRPAA